MARLLVAEVTREVLRVKCHLAALAPRRGAPYVSVNLEVLSMQSLFQILMLLLDVAWFLIIVHVIMSWLINFQVLNLHQQFVAQMWYGLNRLVEPMYAPIRRFLPNMGGLDLAPLVALIAVYSLRIILQNNAGFFFG